MLSRLIKVCLSLVLLLSITACQGLGKTPPQSIVELAIATQLAQTQQALIIHLSPQTPQTPNFKLRNVKVTDQEILPPDSSFPEGASLYQLQGTYQAVIEFPDRQVKDDSIFKIYLQSERDPVTEEIQWQLVKPTDMGWDRVSLGG